jgi:hypothetical protein
MHEKNIIKLKVSGKKCFQPIHINWSNRKRGKVALTNMNIAATITTFKAKKNSCSNTYAFEYKKIPHKTSEPPRNKQTKILHINKILEYSPKKKAANAIAEYSTL